MPAEDPLNGNSHATAYHPEHGLPEGELAEKEQATEERGQRFRVFGLILVVIAGILVLLLTQCTGDGLSTSNTSKKTIGIVEAEQPQAGMISVWVKSGSSVSAVARRAGVQVNATTNLGNGRYVLEVDEGREKHAVAALKALDDVWDAGYVFEDPEPLEGENPTTTP